MVLWGDYVETLHLDKTYLLNNLRVKLTKYERYLNTPRTEKFTATECTPYTIPLADYEEDVSTTSTVNATILGIHQASKSLCCLSCQKRAVEITANNKAVCQSCHLTQLPTSCNVHWSLRILVKPEQSPRNLHLRLDNDVTNTLVQMVDSSLQLAAASEDDLIASLLQSPTKTFKITYDTLTYQVTEVISN